MPSSLTTRSTAALALAASTFAAATFAHTGREVPETPSLSFTLTDFGPSAWVLGMNDHGDVVGHNGAVEEQHATLWRDGKPTRLPEPAGKGSAAEAINDRGEIAGAVWVSASTEHACVWSNGKLTDLGALRGAGPMASSQAVSINSLGQVCGTSNDREFKAHACLWENGIIRDLAPPGGEAEARHINDHGQVVGTANTPDGHTYAFLWEDGRVRNLGAFDGEKSSSCWGVNARGQAIGVSNVEKARRAVMFEQGRVTRLPNPGNRPSDANDINDGGQIVGYFEDARGQFRASLWQQDRMIDLTALLPAQSGWTLRQAQCINSHGQIAGVGSYMGQTHGFLLSPRPATTPSQP